MRLPLANLFSESVVQKQVVDLGVRIILTRLLTCILPTNRGHAWAEIINCSIIGLYVFKINLTGDGYLEFLRNELTYLLIFPETSTILTYQMKVYDCHKIKRPALCDDRESFNKLFPRP